MNRFALTIAGSDTGGGAGIQADIKTFAAFSVYGLSVIAALTAQNSVTVKGVMATPPSFVAMQMDAVLEDFPVHAVKTGMLYTPEVIREVARTLAKYDRLPVVIDPVMMASTGAPLSLPGAMEAMVECLFPLAFLVTPNAHEAETLSGRVAHDLATMKQAAEAIARLGPANVMVKGGHVGEGDIVDLLYSGGAFHEYRKKRIDARHTHGTGCAFSAAITAGLAKGQPLFDAVAEAERFIETAIRHAFPTGAGEGPVNHLARLYLAAGLEPDGQ